MGKPMPGWDVQILDEDENPVGVGERGEICLHAQSNPHLSARLLAESDATREDFEGEVVPHQGRGETDADGYFWYAGRAGDVIISAGYGIGPFEVESACIEHPAVREAAAVASRMSGAETWSRPSSSSRRAARHPTSSQRRSRGSSAETSPPTRIPAGSSSSPSCRRR